jgi:hypothetical protein
MREESKVRSYQGLLPYITVIVQCVVLIKRDLDLRFAVTLLVYSNIIHDPKPYPTTTVNVKSMISEILSRYTIRRVANKSTIIRMIIAALQYRSIPAD